jgi:hypothetical protein
MKQDNTIHVFYPLLTLVLGCLIGVMAYHIFTEPDRGVSPNRVLPQSPLEREMERNRFDLRQDNRRAQPAPIPVWDKDEHSELHPSSRGCQCQ